MNAHFPSPRALTLARTSVKRQRGLILVITLIILVAMTLASLAMIRSVDSATMIAGNMAFRQSATDSGDIGLEAAMVWLKNNGATLNNDIPAAGYYATSSDGKDLTGNKTKATDDDIEWENTAETAVLPADKVGNRISYVIHRMCNVAGPLDGATCATGISEASGVSEGSGKEQTSYQPGRWKVMANIGYYRITARVTGSNNNTSYVQAIVSR